MSRIRSTSSQAEIALGKALWACGLRYRKHYTKVAGKPDYAIVKHRVAVFCDGDFWHGRNYKAKLRKGQFQSNRAYWTTKLPRNIARDRKVNRLLRQAGWHVIRIWESDILADPPAWAARVSDHIARLNNLDRRNPKR
jgi:DNA mismatch endonuclease (patch repair protein)